VIKVIFSSAVVFFLARLAGAALLLSDSFDYPDGGIVTNSGGKWLHHSGSTTGEVLVASSRVELDAANTEDVNALLAGGPYDSTGTTNVFYASFTVRFTTLPGPSGAYFAHFKDTSASGFAARVWALKDGAGANKFRLGISSTSTISATNPTELSLNTDYLVVTRLAIGTSTARLWINPTNELDASVSTSESPSTFVVAAYAFREATSEGVMTVDDLRVGTTFTDVVTNAPPLQAPVITSPPQNQAVVEGGTAVLSVAATGDPPPVYQWQFNGTNLPGATNTALTLSNVTFAAAGPYSVIVSNAIDSTVSEPVSLTVFSAGPPAFSLLTYNLHGNGVLNWSTNTAHVKAIGRQVQYLDPDIMTFQEIPITNGGLAQMINFVTAFRPGFYLATNSSSDGFIQSVILSRFPIVASRSWLHLADLNPFGYTNSSFIRDLFEAEIAVPTFPQHLHVFTAHLKSGQDTDSSNKRAAEAGAISNFFVTAYLSSNSLQPYLLTGDMNEDIQRPPASDPRSIERFISGPAGLQLTTPFNPTNHGELTFSIQATLDRRYDYILPNTLLWSNAVSSQVFRTDLLNPLPPNLFSDDDSVASDHLPVFMVFGNPYNKPFRLLSIARSNQSVSLTWQSVPGQIYRVDASSNLFAWMTLASNLVAAGSSHTFTTNSVLSPQFFRVRAGP
jgi:endonuclease/exonuclease/phosphatase family metal-dependent hydrolase